MHIISGTPSPEQQEVFLALLPHFPPKEEIANCLVCFTEVGVVGLTILSDKESDLIKATLLVMGCNYDFFMGFTLCEYRIYV